MRASHITTALFLALLAPVSVMAAPPVMVVDPNATVPPGTVASYPIRLVNTGGTGEVRLTATGVPAGSTYTITPSVLTSPGTASLRIVTGAATTPSSYRITVSATRGGETGSATAALVIRGDADFWLEASAFAKRQTLVEDSFIPLRIAAINGGSPEITLSATGLPSGYSAVFQPSNIVTGNTAVLLKLTAAANAAIGPVSFQVVGRSGSVSRAVTIRANTVAPTFKLYHSSRPESLKPGRSITQWVALAPSFGFDETVELSATGLPPGVSVDIQPRAIRRAGFAKLTLTAASGALLSRAQFNIIGTVVGTRPKALAAPERLAEAGCGAMPITVGQPDFDLTATPPTRAHLPGQSARFTISSRPLEGFTGPVALSVAGLPAGTTAQFAQTTLSGESSTELEVITPTTLPYGTYLLSVTGLSGALSHCEPLTLTISDDPGITLYTTPRIVVAPLNQSVNAKIELSALNGFSGTVGLAIGGLPDGVSASLSATSLTVSSNHQVNLTFAVAGGTAPGVYPVTIMGVTNQESVVYETTLIVSPRPQLPWSSRDIGPTATPGSTGLDANTGQGVLQASGWSDWTASDSIQYVSRPFTGDAEIVARFTGIQDSVGIMNSRVGLMIRESMEPAARQVFVYMDKNGAPGFLYRNTAPPAPAKLAVVGFPYWLKLVRAGDTVTAYGSSNGSTWSIAGAPVTIPMGTSTTIGLAANAGNVIAPATGLITGGFDRLSVSNGPTFRLSALPTPDLETGKAKYTVQVTPANGFSGTVSLNVSGGPAGTTFSLQPATLVNGTAQLTVTPPTGVTGSWNLALTGTSGSTSKSIGVPLHAGDSGTKIWTSTDIGSVLQTGSLAVTSPSTYQVSGSGRNFGVLGSQFSHQMLSGDGQIVARLTGFEGASANSSSGGVAIFGSLDPSAPYLSLDMIAPLTTSNYGLSWRTATGSSPGSSNFSGLTLPQWLKLVRAGSQISAYRSTDGTNWTQVGSTQTVSLPPVAFIGLQSRGNWPDGGVVKANFDNVTVTGLTNPGVTDFQLSAAPPPAFLTGEIVYTLGVTSNPGFSGSVAMTSSGLPSGVTGTFQPTPVSAPGLTQLRLSVPSNTASGVAAITATGTSGAVVRNVPLSLITYGSPAQIWTSNDIGAPATAGSTALATNTWTLTGGTGRILDTSTGLDAHQFAYRPLSGDGYVIARLASRTGAAGVMVRDSLDPKSRAIFFGFHNDGQFAAVSRLTLGANATRLNMAGTVPVWLKLQRIGSTIHASSSTDGVTWTPYTSYAGFAFGSDLLAGIAVSTGNGVFDSVDLSIAPDFLLSAAPASPLTETSVPFTLTSSGWGGFSSSVALTATGLPANGTATFTPSTLPLGVGTSTLAIGVDPGTPAGAYTITATGTSGAVARSTPVTVFKASTPGRLWVQEDLGVTGRTGSATFDGSLFTQKGAGAYLNDVNGNPDSFSFIRTTVSGDFEFAARVVTRGTGLTGIVVRDSFDPKAKSAGVTLRSVWNDVLFSYRATANASGANSTTLAAVPIRWLKITRVGNTFTAYHSGDGTTWTQVGTPATIAMSAETHVGLALCSQTQATLTTATIDNLSLTYSAGFTISAAPASQNVLHGMTAPVEVSLSSSGGFNTPVDLAVTGIPPGASWAFSQRQLTPAAPASILSVNIGSGTPVGTYPMTISGIAGATTRTAGATLVVGTTDFNLTLNTATRTIAPGGAGTVIATIAAIGGFNGDVAFGVTGIPPGVSVVFNPPTLRGGGTSTATFTTSPLAPLGSTPVTITATSAGVTKSQNFTLILANGSDFSVTSTVSSRTIPPGASTEIPINVETTGGFNSLVNLQVTGIPNGATTTIDPSVLIAPGAATLRIAASAATPRGTFPLTIAGVSGSLRRTLTVNLVISTAADYTLTLSPASATVNAGQSATFTLTVTSATNFGGTLIFDAINLPDGATATFLPATLNQPGTVSVTVNTSAAAVQAASQAFFITAATGGVTRESNPATLTINTSATFSLGATPTTQVVAQSGVARFPVTVTPSGGFASAVALSATGAPAGSTVAFENSTLVIQVPAGATAQDYPITITGTGGNQIKTALVTLTVRVAASYEAEAPGNTLTGSTTSTCTTCSNGQRVDGIGPGTLRFNGVNASASGLYSLNVYYSNPDKTPRSATVAVNGVSTNLSFLAPTTGGLGTVAFATVQIYLESGANTIQFGNTLSAAPSIDRITVMNTSVCTKSAIDVTHVIDCSGSVGGQPFSSAKDAAKQFIDRMDLAQDKIGVVSFTNTGVVRQQLTQTGQSAKNAIDALSSGGNTNIGAGIAAADGELASVRHTPTAQKVMVLLSDGVHTTGPDPMIAANTAKANGVRIITVGYGNHNATVLTALASSPSDYYAAPTGSQVAAVYDAVSTSVCRAPNEAPFSSTGPRQAVPVGVLVSMQGAVSDDGLPANGVLSVTWSKISGPGSVNFTNANTANTTATFSAAGDYVLRITVSDGLLSSYSEVTMTAMASGSDLEGEGINTILSGGATTVPCAICSGGARVDGLGSVTFTVTAPANGSYGLRVYYTNGSTSPRTANVSVNGDSTPRSFTGLPTGTWDTVATTLLTVPLNSGTNTVRFYNDLGNGPSIDRIELLITPGGDLLTSIASSPSDAFPLPAAGSAGAALCRPVNAAPTVFAGPDLTAALGQPIRLRGSASDDGQPGVLSVTWSKISGPGNVIFATPASPQTDVTFDALGTYVLQISASDGALNATARVTVRVGGPVSTHRIQITPSAAGPLLAGSVQFFDAKVVTSAGDPVAAVALQLTVSGANAYSANGTTNTNGIATFSYTGANPGLDNVRVTATALSGVSPISAPVAWVRPNSNVTFSPVTARFFTADSTDLFNTTPAQQPALTEVLTSISINPASQPYGGGPSWDSTRVPPAALLGDAFNTYIGNVPVSGWSGTRWSAVFTGNLIIKTAGQYSLVFDMEGLMIVGVGNGATRVSGPMDGAPALTAFSSLPVMGAKNVGSVIQPNQQTVRINFPSAGVYPFEIDYRRTGPRQGIFVRYQETSIMRAVPPVAVLKINPVESAVRTKGEIQTVTVRATNEIDGPIDGVPVTLAVTGANPQQLLASTDANGNATFQYTGQVSGLIDTLRASAPYGAAQLRSATAKVTWNTGTNQAPLVSAGQPVTTTMPAPALLAGTVNDDGLPAASTLSIQWSKISGPGTVQFDNPSNPQTQATFSQPGTYVLRLSASDGALSAQSDVTITVNPEVTTLTGWITSPIHGSTAMGAINITTNQSLVSGTLTYNNVTINANTTGTGVIGTLDTTTLPNGTYWINLAATNSASQTQTSTVQIHVSGEYKPGRIQTSMTDLVVPLAGMPIRIERQYDSLQRTWAGDFGFGWKLSYNVDFNVDELHNVTMSMNGVRKTFEFTPVPNPIFQSFYAPVYTAPAGLYGKLESTGDTCNGLLVQQAGGGWGCGLALPGQTFQINTWKYTDPAGRAYTWSRTAGLQSIEDLNGNKLTFSPTGISSTSGNLNVPIQRDTFGRITRITDPLGKHYQYGYGPQGDLESVTYPGIATAAQFTYDTGHLLKDYRDPRGTLASTRTYYPDGKLQSVTESGQTTQFAYNTGTRVTTITHPDTGVETTEEDERGNVVRRVDPLSRVTTFTYDSNNNLLAETNPLGKTWTNTYNAQGFRTSVRDPLNHTKSATFNVVGGPLTTTNGLGFTQSITYDGKLNINTITDALGQVAQFSWNPRGLPVTLKDARGNTSSYAYDVNGNQTTYTDPENRTITSAYNALGQLLSETNPRGHSTTYTYDDSGRRTSMRDADNKLWSYEYDAAGNKTADVDPLNHRTTYEYDARNRLTKTIYPDLTFTQTTYDFQDKPLAITDQLGRVTKNEYDLAGQLTKVTYAFGTADAAFVQYSYDLAGRKLTETDERGNTTTNAYDDAGRLITVTNAQNKTKTFTYDDADRQITSTDEKSHTTTFEVDGRGRNTKVTYPDTKFIIHTYDGLGVRTSTTDQDNRTTTWTYDKASQLTQVTNALSQVTSYAYDFAGNRIRQTDARNNSTLYEYDSLNRRTRRTLPAGQFESFTYDAVGSMLTRRNFNTKTTTYAYDTLNRLLSITPDASLGGQTPIAFTYNNVGKRATMSDASGTTTWTYDARDRVKTKATPQGTLTYTYHANSLVASVVSSNTNGTNITYGYDTLSRLQTVTDQAGATTYTWDDAGNPATMTYPNGVVHTFDSDVMDRMNAVTVTKSPSTLATYGYTFGNSGQKLTSTESAGRSTTWGYDAVHKLISENITPDGSISYTHDAVGNRLSRTSTISGIPNSANTFDANDRISGDTFDDDGNTLTSGGHAFAYDFLDRLTNYDSGAVTMIYDGDGNRVSKTAGGVTTRFLIDDLTPTGYVQVAEEVINGTVSRRYTHGNMRISQTTLGVLRYFGYDGGLHVRALTDSSGTPADGFEYDAFGIEIGGLAASGFQYRGERFDAEIAHYYLRARWYDPQTGRFRTRDPKEGSLVEASTLHLYGYAGSNPVDRIDPSGFGFIGAARMLGKITRLSALAAFAQTLSVEMAACVAAKAAAVQIQAALGPVATNFTVACGTAVKLGPLGQIIEREFVFSLANLDARIADPRVSRYINDAIQYARSMGFGIVGGAGHAEENIVGYVSRKGQEWGLLNLGSGWRPCGGRCAPLLRGMRWTSFNLLTCVIF